MKILQIVNRVPFPLNDGGSIGIDYYIKGYLKAGVDLSILMMNTSRDYVDPKILPTFYQQLSQLEIIDINTDIQPLAALKNLLFEKESYNIKRFYQEKVVQVLEKMLQESTYDIIHLDSLFVTDYIPLIRKFSKAKIVIRQHNVEFKIWERLSRSSQSWVKKQYFKILAKRLKAHELSYLSSYDAILAISENDVQTFKSFSNFPLPIYLHPFSIDMEEEYEPNIEVLEADLKIYHIGAMDWLPNQESVTILLEEIAPRVTQEVAGVTFHIAGRYMSENWNAYATDRVFIYGEVESAEEFERDKQVLIVPLKSGAGVRIKIFQAMAAGKLVITSSIGIEGIDAQDKKEVLIANTLEEYVAAIKWIKEHPTEVKELRVAARNLMKKKYNSSTNFRELITLYEKILGH